MKTLWLLRPVKPWEPWYDKSFGFVIRAESEAAARHLAAAECGDEGERVWQDVTATTCIPLLSDGPTELILRDFWAA